MGKQRLKERLNNFFISDALFSVYCRVEIYVPKTVFLKG